MAAYHLETGISSAAMLELRMGLTRVPTPPGNTSWIFSSNISWTWKVLENEFGQDWKVLEIKL